MDSGTGSLEVGRHLLGPHVVGLRVVVRRVLRGQTGPSGRPALTDVLGVCTGWADGECVVQPETGVAVRIAIADIVSGKPVPPRPSVRSRVPAADAQRRALALWPGLESAPLGEWVLRRSGTSSARRANSVLACGDPGHPDPVTAVEAYYRAAGARPIAAVVTDSPESVLFLERGWVPESDDADTLFQVAGVAAAARTIGGRDLAEASVTEEGDLAVARIGERARGIAASDGEWVGFRGLEVHPDHRRQGLGLAVMAALLEWGAEGGAGTAYLQVLGHNAAARALYAGLGFRTHHTYRYLTPAT